MEINEYQTGKKKNGMPYCINLKSCNRRQELKSVIGSELTNGHSHVHPCYSHYGICSTVISCQRLMDNNLSYRVLQYLRQTNLLHFLLRNSDLLLSVD